MNSFRVIRSAAAAVLCSAVLYGCGTAAEPTESGSSGAFDRYEIPTTQPITEAPTDAPTEAPTAALPITEPPTTTAGGLSIGIQIGGEKTDPPASDVRMDAFRSVVEKIYYAGIYPDGSDCGVDGFGQTSDILFAVFDIDEDGEKELIVQNTTACMAAMVEYIFDADASGNITEEFIGFPSTEYYTGGYVTCGVSHNQGLDGRFWPYGLSRYNSSTDTYEDFAFVSAWDSELSLTGYDGEPFPFDADTSGTGIVYYISEHGTETGPMDVTEYEAWYNSLMAGRSKISIPFMNITEANIEKVFG